MPLKVWVDGNSVRLTTEGQGISIQGNNQPVEVGSEATFNIIPFRGPCCIISCNGVFLSLGEDGVLRSSAFPCPLKIINVEAQPEGQPQAAPAAPATEDPKEAQPAKMQPWEIQLQELEAMGFVGADLLAPLLAQFAGDVNAVVQHLLEDE